MFKTNEYFDGKVKSIAFETPDGPATVGVMAAGDYEFGTSSIEHMTVISGTMDVMQPGDSDWKSYMPFETFIVPKGITFKLKIPRKSAYLCLYK